MPTLSWTKRTVSIVAGYIRCYLPALEASLGRPACKLQYAIRLGFGVFIMFVVGRP